MYKKAMLSRQSGIIQPARSTQPQAVHKHNQPTQAQTFLVKQMQQSSMHIRGPNIYTMSVFTKPQISTLEIMIRPVNNETCMIAQTNNSTKCHHSLAHTTHIIHLHTRTNIFNEQKSYLVMPIRHHTASTHHTTTSSTQAQVANLGSDILVKQIQQSSMHNGGPNISTTSVFTNLR